MKNQLKIRIAFIVVATMALLALKAQDPYFRATPNNTQYSNSQANSITEGLGGLHNGSKNTKDSNTPSTTPKTQLPIDKVFEDKLEFHIDTLNRMISDPKTEINDFYASLRALTYKKLKENKIPTNDKDIATLKETLGAAYTWTGRTGSQRQSANPTLFNAFHQDLNNDFYRLAYEFNQGIYRPYPDNSPEVIYNHISCDFLVGPAVSEETKQQYPYAKGKLISDIPQSMETEYIFRRNTVGSYELIKTSPDSSMKGLHIIMGAAPEQYINTYNLCSKYGNTIIEALDEKFRNTQSEAFVPRPTNQEELEEYQAKLLAAYESAAKMFAKNRPTKELYGTDAYNKSYNEFMDNMNRSFSGYILAANRYYSQCNPLYTTGFSNSTTTTEPPAFNLEFRNHVLVEQQQAAQRQQRREAEKTARLSGILEKL